MSESGPSDTVEDQSTGGTEGHRVPVHSLAWMHAGVSTESPCVTHMCAVTDTTWQAGFARPALP